MPKFDFGGYATRNDITCTDGRVIRRDAFADNNGITVPLVWQHVHDNPSNVLGHALLENREDGVYCYCSFNDSESGKNSKIMVQHGDIKALSIYAKELKQQGLNVLHGAIKEVSLCLAGANPGAFIDNLSIQHGDMLEEIVEEAIIYSGDPISIDEIEHSAIDNADETVQDVFDTLTEKQHNIVYAMLNDALEGGTAAHADIAANPTGETVQDVFDTLTDKQKNVVYAMLADALDQTAAHSDVSTDESVDTTEDTVEHANKINPINVNIMMKKAKDMMDAVDASASTDTAAAKIQKANDMAKVANDMMASVDVTPAVIKMANTMMDKVKGMVKAAPATTKTVKSTNGDKVVHSIEGGNIMKNNVFDNATTEDNKVTTLSHAQVSEILTDAKKSGSLKDSFFAHVATYGVDAIDVLFPDARVVNGVPEVIKRDDVWVEAVLTATNHTPFSRIKSTAVDITADEARARGYLKGGLKKDEVIKLLKRITTPQTIYKKQKLDRDDIVDITDLDVVAWLKAEMRVMLNEEIARAVLVGDGRGEADESKINTDNIRPIYLDEVLYAPHVDVSADPEEMVDDILRARKLYRGSGNPMLYTSQANLIEMLLVRDTTGRKIYTNISELSLALGVSGVIEVPVMEGVNRMGTETTPLQHDLIGIIVNLKDYTIGADKGGAISMFDDFDIDYNQQKYLIETRCSGALTKPYSAIVIEKLHA